MGVGSFCEELKSPIPPSRLWTAAVVDVHNLLPKIAPQFVASIDVVEGDGGVGTVKVTNFAQGIKGLTSVRSRTDAIDEANFYYKYSIIDPNDESVIIASYEYKFDPSEDGGSTCKISGEQKTVGDHDPTEAETNVAKDTSLKAFKGIEAYLQAIPDAYV